MKRADLEHILRASKSVTGETEFVIVGSQAILGEFPDAAGLPASLIARNLASFQSSRTRGNTTQSSAP
jgi:hypothetical protein